MSWDQIDDWVDNWSADSKPTTLKKKSPKKTTITPPKKLNLIPMVPVERNTDSDSESISDIGDLSDEDLDMGMFKFKDDKIQNEFISGNPSGSVVKKKVVKKKVLKKKGTSETKATDSNKSAAVAKSAEKESSGIKKVVKKKKIVKKKKVVKK